MGNKSSSSSTPLPPYVLRSSRQRAPPCTVPFLAAPAAFHQSATSLHHFSGTDSGYMTSPTDSERWRTESWKLGQSRLSLNEGFVIDRASGMPQAVLPAPAFVPLPPPTLKQFKKWQKKQKKLLKKMGSMAPAIIPPPVVPILPYARAFSVDNLSRFFFCEIMCCQCGFRVQRSATCFQYCCM
ncbi:unnamed protein product [Gongylonema pulchrum]|uniref:Uncharacterized protein n=1 Tax=Gongylonema pulchrum TaxID=637853 RepID=A0A183DZX3_9BILA|nr:unnamed protein product [Gongylonema pulchrum]